MDPVLATALESGATVVTANHHVARSVAEWFSARQAQQGAIAWETPDVVAWDAWLERLWREQCWHGPQAPLPLTVSQEQYLWEQIIGASAAPLLHTPAAAQSAREAWRLLHEWRLETPLETLAGAATQEASPENLAFREWSRQFMRRVDEARRIDSGRLPGAVLAGFERGQRPAGRTTLLVGFDEFSPRQKQLLEALAGKGSPVSSWQPPSERAEAVRVALPDAAAELRAAAHWARALLQRDPGARINIVVPELAGLRKLADRSFADVLTPGTGLDRRDPAHHLSLGRGLGEVGVIRTALEVLELADGPQPFEAVGRLLRSPFLAGAATEAARRALLDARVRQLGRLVLGLDTVAHHAGGSGNPAASHTTPNLSRALFACSQAINGWPARAPPSIWAGHFAHLLKTAGWPRGRSLDSGEFQAVERWQQLLTEFSGLDVVSPRLSSKGAVRGLGSLAARTVFQPRAPAHAVHVTGTLEAAGLTFDHLWVSGLHAERWPPPPRPNPFLPLALQRRSGMPNASNERQLEFARRVTQRLLACAPRVVVSWPRQEGEAVLSPSPLIRPLEQLPADNLPGVSARGYVTAVFEQGAMESLDTDPALPLADTGPATGGSRLLQHQAQCPFRACAQWRLAAHPLETPQIGIDPRLRGKIVHRALERLWSEIRSHQSLLQLSDEALERHITAASRDAVTAAIPGGSNWLRHLARLEQDRLQRLLRLFLALEKERPPFTVVGSEVDEEVCAGPLRLRTRVDRIDALADGGLAVIDYKTGEASPTRWFGDRPEEPQLPLYAVTRTGEVAAVVFAMLRPGAVGFQGLSRSPGLVPGARSERGWEDTLENWRCNLAALGRDFAAGAAAVAPKSPAACTYCHLASLCRIDEHRARGRGIAG